ncbi:MAG: cation:proton antiporter [Lactobacillales bacterium]|nr:cation:proton antiporter [Lactobacillales bacterium]
MTEYGMIAVILMASILAGAIFVRLQLPAVIGQLLVGIFLGPALLNFVHLTKPLQFIAEIGVIFLMFIAGLEADLSLLKKFIKPAVSVAFIGVFFPLAIFFGITQLWGYNKEQALLFGLVYAATSVSITIGVLQEYDRLNTKEGATILGAAVVDDILAVLLLSFFVTMCGNQSENSSIGWTLLLQALYMIFLFVIIRFFAPRVMKFFYELPIFASGVIGAVIICLMLAELAKKCDMSDVIGAFFAGVAVAQSKEKIRKKIENSLSIIGYSFFIPIFFASIGLQMSFTSLRSFCSKGLFFLFMAVVTKLIGCGIAARANHFSLKSSYIIGAGMVSRGEMGLVVAQIGFAQAMINKEVYSELVVVIILCTLIAPLLLKHSFSQVKNKQC